VLLKNDGVLPLSRDLRTLAVIGPTADDIMSLLGNYYGTPAAPVTVLQGIRDAVGSNTRCCTRAVQISSKVARSPVRRR
jgi:beta-glucosidase